MDNEQAMQAIRYEQLYLLPVLGLNTAVLSMVGQNFGAKQINRVSEIYDKALLFGCTFMFFSGFIGLCWIFGAQTSNEDKDVRFKDTANIET